MFKQTLLLYSRRRVRTSLATFFLISGTWKPSLEATVEMRPTSSAQLGPPSAKFTVALQYGADIPVLAVKGQKHKGNFYLSYLQYNDGVFLYSAAICFQGT